jgi:multidrug efflux system outer membrane protein
LTEATARVHALSTATFRNGAASYLDVLDAQRSLYTAQQNSITLRLVEQINRIALYRALGGGWSERDAAGLAR